MGRKALAVVLILVIFGWAFLGIETAARMGALNDFMAGPEGLRVTSSVVETSNGSVLIIEWHLQRKPLERLLNGRDSVFLFYPFGVSLPHGVYTFLRGVPWVNLTVYPAERQVNRSEMSYDVWYYDTPGFATPHVEMVRASYLVPSNVTGGRIELPLQAMNYSRCSVIPVVLVYFHETGGSEVEPSHISTRLTIRPGPGYPVFGNGTLETLFSFNVSKWVEFTYWEKRGGWVEVRVFNATLPCESD
ncbi:hypothetical protein [Thermococcus aciditolerans]|uniref:Uncharacterized protein n=1 Tax=Thermococcus aciditolerans TaxID=2598455 RepID=A0A5C0SK60_9EURY|nr:hypothetical protein [Thermococcus aciditolerans]QEK14711.1 hypothetical protein FPV09_05950 [Thermococcus aciditolerans]